VVEALLPPLIVAVSFCLLVFSLLRHEIGRKREDPSPKDNGRHQE
jgi:hypothetical protein